MIPKNIGETIKAKMQQEHSVREDRLERFTDNWAAVPAEVQSDFQSGPHMYHSTNSELTPGNLEIGAMAAPPSN